ncbi:hypothetical protein EDD85DRAFT_983231 [Armillaria nabsnona]|nr:hypothetical protein EDD85DRAFT_983231 [Armillaria nabsnona]
MEEIYSQADTLDSPDVDDLSLLTPTSIMSGSSSPNLDKVPDTPMSVQKKKKKKKTKKSAKAKSEAAAKLADEDGPPVLCISRNKHWRYISSYHGPWLQLLIKLLESLLVLNLNPATLSAAELRIPSIPPSPNNSTNTNCIQDCSFHDLSPPDSPCSLPLPPPIPPLKPGKATPPRIDPGVFWSITSIWWLIDEAAKLSVRVSSGLSAAELGSMHGGLGVGCPWVAAQMLGINPLGNEGIFIHYTCNCHNISE